VSNQGTISMMPPNGTERLGHAMLNVRCFSYGTGNEKREDHPKEGLLNEDVKTELDG